MEIGDLAELDDVALMTRFQRGDDCAYETLVRRHVDFVHRHARRFIDDEAGAEDVVQEVFLRLYRSGRLFREPTNFTGWLATMTGRLALNELRTRARKRWVARSSLEGERAGREWRPGPSGGEPSDAAAEGLGPEAVLQNERISAVRRAIARLPERQRQALLLQRFEGWNLERVGEALDLSIPAVKSLLHRARASLERSLESYIRGGPVRGSAAPGRTA